MPDREPIRVVIADDQPIVRSGLGALLMAYSDLELVGEAEDGQQAVELCELVQPDVILMDIKMPTMDGIAATREIRQRWPDIQILVLTSFKEKGKVQSALDAGATGYMLKDVGADELAQAIKNVYLGRQTVAQEATQAVEQAEHLEKLEEEIQAARPEQVDIAHILERHLPTIFPGCQIQIRFFPATEIFCHPAQPVTPIPEAVWAYLKQSREAATFMSGERHSWDDEASLDGDLLLAPILKASGGAAGGLVVFCPGAGFDLDELLPAGESLAGIIAAVLGEQEDRTRRQQQRQAAQELQMAGRIQAGILPEKAPTIHGWDIAAKLEPARETSGDFFDFIPLANGKWGVVIADVTDKGLGAAVFMALSSTLIRTYASRYPTLPALAMSSVNERILSDTRGSMFVTTFYGVLEPDTGRMRYVNAGHNPPYLLSNRKSKPLDSLRGTGMALGISEDANWGQKLAKFAPGDVLVLFTDGITEAQNRWGEFFGEQRLVNVIQDSKNRPARKILEAILTEVHNFMGEAPPQDDITLLVLIREI
jgi:serine phosphatase RsbU (regulator of sigma subunit)/DNA-binding NarL/FixJ family response regulator